MVHVTAGILIDKGRVPIAQRLYDVKLGLGWKFRLRYDAYRARD